MRVLIRFLHLIVAAGLSLAGLAIVSASSPALAADPSYNKGESARHFIRTLCRFYDAEAPMNRIARRFDTSDRMVFEEKSPAIMRAAGKTEKVVVKILNSTSYSYSYYHRSARRPMKRLLRASARQRIDLYGIRHMLDLDLGWRDYNQYWAKNNQFYKYSQIIQKRLDINKVRCG